MKIESIKCNGLTGGYGNATLNVQSTIQTAVAIFRMRHDDIFSMLPHGEYHNGTRFSSDENVTNRICSGLHEAAIHEITGKHWPSHNANDEQFVQVVMMIENFIENISGTDMDALILEGMRDCASSDHWYVFEKQWV
jgi:hypothetical protein